MDLDVPHTAAMAAHSRRANETSDSRAPRYRSERPSSTSAADDPGRRYIEISVVLPPAGLGENLDAPAAGPRVLRRIRILVDADLLNGRRADIQRAHFHPIDDNGHTPGAERSRIEK